MAQPLVDLEIALKNAQRALERVKNIKALEPEKKEAVMNLADAMFDDHVKYPQLRLPKMQLDRLKRILKLLY